MTTTGETDGLVLLTEEEMHRFIVEVVTSAGGDGTTTGDIEAAYDEFHAMLVSTGLVLAWQDRKLRVGWDLSARELRFYPFTAVEEVNS